MAGVDERIELVNRFFSGTGATYDRVVALGTLGIDRRWKRALVEAIPPRASRVLDLACGTGILTLEIARRLPHARVVGVELRDEYLEYARRKVARLGVANVELVLCRAEDYAPATRFDCVVSSYLAKYADLDVLARNAHALLEPGGLVLAHDFTYPPKPALARVWRAYLRLMELVGSPLLPAWREIFRGLPDLVAATRWTTELPEALARAGFAAIETRYLTAYGSAIVSARR